ncbi:MAG: phosphatidylglycerol lysyltransferase domain-containing protein [Coxiellaceae bacterium]|nr:phosphatidylglycerol lysyltransferase domain-containing protein [Coxiellaceae bacterium]
MQWINFERQHKKLLDNYFGLHNEFSNISYTNFLLWQHSRHYQLARHQQHLYIRFRRNQQWCYFFPFSHGNTKHALDNLLTELDQPAICFDSLSARQLKELIESDFVGVESQKKCRDDADYVYLIEDLIALKGQAYRAKRNFCHQFDVHYNPVYQQISRDNVHLVHDFLSQWFADKKTENQQSEWQGIRYFLANYQATDCIGGMLLVDGAVVAVTFGEPLNQDTVVIHIEKANTEYRGVYQAINRRFLQEHWSHYSYVNRQQDLGIEGLRKAKMSYHPVHLIDKYNAEVNSCLELLKLVEISLG